MQITYMKKQSLNLTKCYKCSYEDIYNILLSLKVVFSYKLFAYLLLKMTTRNGRNVQFLAFISLCTIYIACFGK